MTWADQEAASDAAAGSTLSRTDLASAENPPATSSTSLPASDNGRVAPLPRRHSWVSIASLAAELGVSFRTLRYYETVGLLRPMRTATRGRIYDADQCDRARIIIQLRSYGLGVGDIAHLLSGDRSTASIRQQIINSVRARAHYAQREADRAQAAVRALSQGANLPLSLTVWRPMQETDAAEADRGRSPRSFR